MAGLRLRVSRSSSKPGIKAGAMGGATGPRVPAPRFPPPSRRQPAPRRGPDCAARTFMSAATSYKLRDSGEKQWSRS
eukprot:2035811-Rhodomonas_salina.8